MAANSQDYGSLPEIMPTSAPMRQENRPPRLSEMRRLGTSEDSMLHVQSNLAITYRDLGRLDEAHESGFTFYKMSDAL